MFLPSYSFSDPSHANMFYCIRNENLGQPSCAAQWPGIFGLAWASTWKNPASRISALSLPATAPHTRCAHMRFRGSPSPGRAHHLGKGPRHNDRSKDQTPAFTLTPMKVPRLSPVRQQRICNDNGTKGKASAVKHGQKEAVPEH